MPSQEENKDYIKSDSSLIKDCKSFIDTKGSISYIEIISENKTIELITNILTNVDWEVIRYIIESTNEESLKSEAERLNFNVLKLFVDFYKNLDVLLNTANTLQD